VFVGFADSSAVVRQMMVLEVIRTLVRPFPGPLDCQTDDGKGVEK
jgi:hypothetical protein